MIIRNRILARRYAQAFVNAFGHQLRDESIDRFRAVAQLITKRKAITIFLSLPCVDDRHKYAMIDRICSQMGALPAVNELITLLLKHKRAELLAQVFFAIADRICLVRGIEYFAIESFPELQLQQLEAVVKALEHMTRHAIRYTYRVNARVVAGVRAQSDTHVYDDSIAGKLRTISQRLKQ